MNYEMVFYRFEDIKGWQKAQDLAVFIYQHFNAIKDFTFKDQIFRASISISNNIAEGFDRSSDKEFSRYLYIANGSNSEVKPMLYLARRINYIDENIFKIGIDQCDEIGKIIHGLLKALKPSN